MDIGLVLRLRCHVVWIDDDVAPTRLRLRVMGAPKSISERLQVRTTTLFGAFLVVIGVLILPGVSRRTLLAAAVASFR
jgi:hypothetical protein